MLAKLGSLKPLRKIFALARDSLQRRSAPCLLCHLLRLVEDIENSTTYVVHGLSNDLSRALLGELHKGKVLAGTSLLVARQPRGFVSIGGSRAGFVDG
jgi:hypothetical protein